MAYIARREAHGCGGATQTRDKKSPHNFRPIANRIHMEFARASETTYDVVFLW
jgi:hypothetical protein